jgi:hypothetical protein
MSIPTPSAKNSRSRGSPCSSSLTKCRRSFDDPGLPERAEDYAASICSSTTNGDSSRSRCRHNFFRRARLPEPAGSHLAKNGLVENHFL